MPGAGFPPKSADQQPDDSGRRDSGSVTMSTLTSTLLDFILSLLRDPSAAQSFSDHPEQALSDAGLSDVCGADVQALVPMLADYAPAGVSPYHSVGSSYKPHASGRDSYQQGPEHDGGYQAIEHIKYVQQNYSYHPTQVLDFSHSVWGDQYNVWADDSAVAINGGVAAGGDISHSDVKTASNNGDGGQAGFGNHQENDGSFNSNSGDGNAFGSHAQTDAFNTEDSNNNNGNDIGGGGNVLGDHNDVTNHDTGNVAGDGGNSGDNGQVDNSHVDVGPIDVGGVAIAGENAVAGENNNNANDSAGVVQAGDDINHSLDDNFSDNFSHDLNGNEVETAQHHPAPPMGQGEYDLGHMAP
jgi:hypothetical protein